MTPHDDLPLPDRNVWPDNFMNLVDAYVERHGVTRQATFKEISAITGRSISTVRGRYDRGRDSVEVRQLRSAAENAITLTDEQKKMVMACITQCLWHTEFFFKSDEEREATIAAYEAIAGKPLDPKLHGATRKENEVTTPTEWRIVDSTSSRTYSVFHGDLKMASGFVTREAAEAHIESQQARKVVASIKVTEVQAEGIAAGLDVDRDEEGDAGLWGALRYVGPNTAWLDVFDLDAAIYRVTSTRDIYDTAAGDGERGARQHARSMQLLTDKLVEAAGGPDKLDDETKRWL